jgi:hypothetical protein
MKLHWWLYNYLDIVKSIVLILGLVLVFLIPWDAKFYLRYFFVGGGGSGTGIWTQDFKLTNQVLYFVSHTSIHSDDFGNGVLLTVFLCWPWSSQSQPHAARITGVSCWHLDEIFLPFWWVHVLLYTVLTDHFYLVGFGMLYLYFHLSKIS